MYNMNHLELRRNFLKYFEKKEHKIVASSSLIPSDDPTLMFTNAGMNQFKDVLLGNEVRSYKRATSVQKCLRVAGKHNDFEAVGYDGYHHTFFEMLGNWSFGDYYKKETIEFAWEYLTKELKIAPNNFIVSIYKDDDESYEIWTKIIKIPSSKILRLGDISKGDEENFWSMGETGPCGFCSEIHYDLGENFEKKLPPNFPGYDKRYIEVWNLVFMEFYRDANGNFTPLKMKSVDTGMGFERLYTILNEKYSNYHTDLFLPIINKIEDLSSKSYKDDPISFQVISDHIRALSFALADGGIFSNEGRGYILRKILRRASRYLKKLEVSEPALYKIVPTLVTIMGDFYPELKEKKETIEKLIKMEEEKFLSTLNRGLKVFDKMIEYYEKNFNNKLKILDGKDVFKLYDTYGLPLEVIKDLAKEYNYLIDEEKFLIYMEEHRKKSKWTSAKKFF